MVAAEETPAKKATATENETKAPEYIGAAAGKYQWDDPTRSDSWSDGKKTESTYTELD